MGLFRNIEDIVDIMLNGIESIGETDKEKKAKERVRSKEGYLSTIGNINSQEFMERLKNIIEFYCKNKQEYNSILASFVPST